MGPATDDHEAEVTEDEVRDLWAWVSRPTKVQLAALVLVSCLALGPLGALAMILRNDTTAVQDLVVAPPADAATSTVTVTATGVAPSSGELRVRVLLQPAPDLLGDDGRLAEPVELAVNDARGTLTHTYDAGQPGGPFEAVLPIVRGSITRYPVDRYEVPLLVAMTVGDGDDKQPAPIVVGARSTVSDFELAAAVPDDLDGTGPQLAGVEWTATRPATTTVYAVWLMVLMWGLAVTGILIAWAVLIWRAEVPMWAFGYFVGVLFALPPLRNSLPGAPPPGTIFDFVSFYWSITIVGVTLMLLLGVWVRQARSQHQLHRLEGH